MSRRAGQWVLKGFKELGGQMTEKLTNLLGILMKTEEDRWGEVCYTGIWEGAVGRGTANTRPQGKIRKEVALFYTPGVLTVLFFRETCKKFC